MTVLGDALAAALYGEDDASLDRAASLLAADPGTDALLQRRGEEFVRQAWERGWQPADLLRCVRRELAEPHLRLLGALVLAETGSYARLPPRWADQLAELDGTPWRADRFSRATAVLELHRVLSRLPPIEPVGPVPGEPFVAPSGYEPRMLNRIRALLAKAEATTYPDEAEALTAKAQELMSRHSVDDASLAPKSTAPSACRIGVDPPYETAKAILLDAAASANRCRAVWNSAFEFSTVVGFEGDLESVELLYTSLLVQGTAAMTRAEGAQRAGGRKRTKTFRQSFLMAYAARLGERLSAAAQGVSAPEDLLPVLATREVAVTARTDELFPRTTTTRVRGVTDEAGWLHGREAADQARVSPERRTLPGR